MIPIALRIYGTPAPQGSKSAFVRGGRAVLVEGKGPGRASHTAWRQAIASTTRDYLETHPGTIPFDSACIVHVTFLLPRPKSLPKKRLYPETKPDLDKCTRALLDGLVDGGLLLNDSRVVELNAKKRYAHDEPPGALVTLYAAEMVVT